MISRDFIQGFVANARCGVLTDPANIGPLPGKYWLLHHVSIFDSDNNGQAYAMYLVDPIAYSGLQAAIANNTAGGGAVIPDFTAASSGGPPSGIHRLAPGDGNDGGVVNWETTSQRGGGGSSPNNTGFGKILIPSGWALYVVETNGVVSAIPHQILLRIAYAELDNGCSPYKDGPWWI